MKCSDSASKAIIPGKKMPWRLYDENGQALAKNINLRNTPAITFIIDQSIEYGVEMSKKIDEVTKNLKED